MRAGIALGSNLGDRYALIQAAIAHLKSLHEQGNFLCSSLHETIPQDCLPGTPTFLNAVVELETSLTPIELLMYLQELEVQAGRPKEHEFHGPRTLDLDILYCDQVISHSKALTLPHPEITKRFFVLKPLSEIRPDLRLPGWKMHCNDYLLHFSNIYIQDSCIK